MNVTTMQQFRQEIASSFERAGDGVKALVQWDILKGALYGPRLTDGRTNDHKTLFPVEEIPAESLYIADLGFLGLSVFVA